MLDFISNIKSIILFLEYIKRRNVYYSHINEMKYIEENHDCSGIYVFMRYPPQFWQLYILFRKKDINSKHMLNLFNFSG